MAAGGPGEGSQRGEEDGGAGVAQLEEADQGQDAVGADEETISRLITKVITDQLGQKHPVTIEFVDYLFVIFFGISFLDPIYCRICL